MKKIIPFFLLMVSCGTAPTDGSPSYDTANRFSVEMKNDCNTAKHSVGISGCAFKISEIGGNLTLPSLWSGNIGFTSYNCKNISAVATNNSDNIFQIKDMYNAGNQQSCSFGITRTIRDGKFISDDTMIGRFFIKILPDISAYAPLNFSIGNDTFNGVGWYQKKTDGADAVLQIKPTTPKGKFTVACGEVQSEISSSLEPKIIYRTDYTSTPFLVKLESNIICDYEMVAVNEIPGDDGIIIESATYIHEVQQYTKDITVPVVAIKSNQIGFTFNDQDVSGNKPVVYAVQIDNTKFLGTNTGKVPNIKDKYIVKGITPALRYFYGEYTVSTKSWLVQ